MRGWVRYTPLPNWLNCAQQPEPSVLDNFPLSSAVTLFRRARDRECAACFTLLLEIQRADPSPLFRAIVPNAHAAVETKQTLLLVWG